MRYLERHYPECSGAPELHAYQQAAHEAAVAGDRDAYEEALRDYMRAGRAVALNTRKGAA
jgi:Arc/MetJ family transcription regulator